MAQKEKKEEKEEDLLKEQCGDDTELHAFLCHTLYVDPASAISKSDLAALIDEAEENVRDENYGHAWRNYQLAVNKAIFEATQNPGEKNKYVKIVRELAPKTTEVIEKVKEKAEREGLDERARYLEKEIRNYAFLTERIQDVVKIASLYYQGRLEKMRAEEREAAVKVEKKDTGRTEED